MQGGGGAGRPDRLIWQEPNEADVQCVREQLQRNVKDILGVVVRCRYGRPQVVANRPILWDGQAVDDLPGVELDPKRVGIFPTLFWLTCPHLNRAIGRLESAGWVERLKQEVSADAGARQQLEAAHRETAHMRLQLVSKSTRDRLQEALPGHYHVLAASGVGGIQPARTPLPGNMNAADDTDDALGVKCLHAHFADYLARGSNPVGRRVWELLTATGVDPRGHGRCFAGRSCGCPGGDLAAGGPQGDGAAKPGRIPEALIDVGSNSVRLLVGYSNPDGEMTIIDRTLMTTRLGAGVSENGQLAPQAIEETLNALRTYRDRAMALGASEPKAWGTSALREAENRTTLLIRSWEEVGIALRLMSGEEEAELSFRGGLRGFSEFTANQPVLLADIGGGSTDMVLGDAGGSILWKQSIPLGAVRLKKEMVPTEGRTGQIELQRSIRAALEAGFADMPERANWPSLGLLDQGAKLIIVGGTVTSLAAMDLGLATYDPARVNGHVLALSDIQVWLNRLVAMRTEQRAQVPGLPKQREDIIVPGLIILVALMEWFVEKGLGMPLCHVSDRDLLEGALER